VVEGGRDWNTMEKKSEKVQKPVAIDRSIRKREKKLSEEVKAVERKELVVCLTPLSYS